MAKGSKARAIRDGQRKDDFDGFAPADLADFVRAYEAVWAIGTGRTATAAQAGEAHAHIRKRLRQWFGADAADRCHLLYGGSGKPGNIAQLVAEADVDGALVGGAGPHGQSLPAIGGRGPRGAVEIGVSAP